MTITTLARRALPLSTSAISLIKSWKAADKRYDAKQARLRAEKERIEKQLEGMKPPSAMEKIIVPIGQALLAGMPGCEMEVFGPFGLDAQMSIHFDKKGLTHKQKMMSRSGKSITFIHSSDTGVKIRDTSKDTKSFAPNSIGELNGMNHPTIDIPAAAPLSWFRKFVR